MANAFSVRYDSSNLTALLNGMRRKAAPEIRKANEDIVEHGVELIQADTPVRTGNLQDSIKGEASTEEAHIYQDADQAPYGIFVEFGTRNMAAQPFFYPNVPRIQRYAKERYAQALKAIARR